MTLRLLMEESGMITWDKSQKGKPLLRIKSNCINQLKALYPDKKKEIRLGERAKDELVMSLKGMVVKTAKYYTSKFCLDNSRLEDLLQIGFLNATYALYKFDGTKNTKFSSYAQFWIDVNIMRGIYQDYLIKANLNYDVLKLTIPQYLKRFDLLAISTDLIWLYLSQKTIYPSYPFKFYSQTKNIEGDSSDIFDTIPHESKKHLADEIRLILSQDEIDIITSDDQTTKKKKDNAGILEMAMTQGIPLDSFYDKKQQIINKVKECIEV